MTRGAMQPVALAYPPSLNNAYPTVVGLLKNGQPFQRRKIDPRYFAWREEATITLRRYGHPPPPAVDLALVYYAWVPPDHRPHDVDNLTKGISDAIGVAYDLDDDRFTVEHSEKGRATTRASACVVVVVVTAPEWRSALDSLLGEVHRWQPA